MNLDLRKIISYYLIRRKINELNNIRQSIAGKWGNDSQGNTYTGNLVHGITTSGNTVKSSGMSSRSILIVCFTTLDVMDQNLKMWRC